ncbi:MAG: mechanosensitive ion channel [Nitrospirae bacterium]|nr:mechanosensitive ion channel [Nitrospirota bacterium]NTW66096.1 mechanosensitive ion channel [Nitrospirota bacterium]
MELIQALTGSLLWATLFSIGLFVGGSIATNFLAKKSKLLEPIASGLKLIALFVALQAFLILGGNEGFPAVARYFQFFSWLIAIFALLRLTLYMYGDLFVVRWKKGSFPAAFKNIITMVILVVSVLFLMKGILDINVTSLIATTTVLTATIGLAFQSTLANMLAGLTIHLEKPLRQGDWIAAGGHEGHVLDITLRSTRMRTIEKNEVFIPNSYVLAGAVVNYSLPDQTTYRKVTVGVSYQVAPNTVRRTVLDVLASVDGVHRQPEPLVRVLNFGDFSVNYEIRYAIHDYQRYLEIESDIMNLLWYRFRRDGIEIPFPIQTVHLKEITAESRRAEREQAAAEVLALMGKVDILAPLSQEERRKLVETVGIKTYAVGECPVLQGEAGDSFYIIRKGSVDVLVQKEAGECVVVATLGAGNFFGEMSLLTGAARTATIRVTEDAEFVVIDRESFRGTLIHNPSIAESLSRILAERQAALAAQREKLDAVTFERRKRDESGKLLHNIREFFGLH